MREIVYEQTRSGQFKPAMSRAALKKAEKAKQNRRDTWLGAAIIVAALAVWAGGLLTVALV